MVLQYVVLASSLFLRLIHNHIYNIQDKCKNELSLYLKTKKTYEAKSHRRRAKELMIIFLSLFFSVLALVLSSCWIWLKQKDYLAWLTTTMKYFASGLSMFLFDIVSWLLQDTVCKLWSWWRIFMLFWGAFPNLKGSVVARLKRNVMFERGQLFPQ